MDLLDHGSGTLAVAHPGGLVSISHLAGLVAPPKRGVQHHCLSTATLAAAQVSAYCNSL